MVTLISFFGFGPITPASRSMIWLLVINFVLIGVLALFVGQDFFRLRSGEVGVGNGKLARQFVGLFSLAAVLPAIFVAVFLGTSLNRSIENWFSIRIKEVVENSATVSRSNLQSIADDIRLDVGIMAIDLNTAVVGFETEPEVFARFLREQAAFREFTGALIINSDSKIILASDPISERLFEKPDPEMFVAADSGDVSVQLSDSTSRFWALFKLDAFENAFLYTARPINPKLLASLLNAEGALSEYRLEEERSRRRQIIFLLGFFQITALILLFFIRFGIQAANQITRPIALLAEAADDVRKGNLSVLVDMPNQDNEVADLTSSFNAMTTRLREQRDEIDTARREAIERSAFIEAVLQGVSAGVVRVDEHMKVTLTNPSACNMFPAFLIMPDAALPEISREFGALVSDAMIAGEPRSATVEISDGGSQRHFLVRAEPTDDESPGCILTFDDTSRLILAQRQMAWRDVARRVAHEIRNPLTPIQLSAERLRRRYRKQIDPKDTIFDRCIDTITRQVSDIGRMVEEFSSFARMPKPELEDFDLISLVRNCVFDARLSKPDIRFQLICSQSEIHLPGDRRLLGQAITNLLKNAAEAVEGYHATHPQDDTIRSVDTRIWLGEESVEIDFEDNGPGFPTDNRHQILEPYYTTREQGVGLGLAIVNRIIQDHGGSLSLLDRADRQRGARVSLSLPLAGPANENVSSWARPEESTL